MWHGFWTGKDIISLASGKRNTVLQRPSAPVRISVRMLPLRFPLSLLKAFIIHLKVPAKFVFLYSHTHLLLLCSNFQNVLELPLFFSWNWDIFPYPSWLHYSLLLFSLLTDRFDQVKSLSFYFCSELLQMPLNILFSTTVKFFSVIMEQLFQWFLYCAMLMQFEHSKYVFQMNITLPSICYIFQGRCTEKP